jgi:signal transduction histidine kinase
VAADGQSFTGVAPPKNAQPQTTNLARELGDLAQFANTAAAANGCLIALRTPSGEDSVWAAAAGPPQHHAGRQVLDLMKSWSSARSDQPLIVHRLSPSDVAILHSLGLEAGDSACVTLACRTEGLQTIAVAIVSAAAGVAMKSIAELTVRCTSSLLSDSSHSQQASFWRSQAGQLRDALQAARTQAAEATRAQARNQSSNRRLVAHAERGNLSALASTLSRLGSFDAWFLATREGDGLRIRTAHGLPRDALAEPGRALRQALTRHIIISRRLGTAVVLSAEERRFQSLGYRAYLCVPLEGGVLGLLSRNAVTVAARQRVADSLRAVAPHLRGLFLSRELERQRALVRSLARGLFRSADAERARLRRDLHDDWAQLLAAAQIALNGGSDDARRFFRELEGELRKRLDALRPLEARRVSFKAALKAEVQRLERAGLEVTVSVRGVSRLPATAKEVFRRVISEGVSNVIRHAAANQVRIGVECRDGAGSVAITDNGRGTGAASEGVGLRGLAERVEVLGGRCVIASNSAGTRLSARIPLANL